MLKLKSANILQISDGEICALVTVNNIGQISIGELCALVANEQIFDKYLIVVLVLCNEQIFDKYLMVSFVL